MSWKGLGSVDPTELQDARLQCHVAATLLARLARGYLEAKPDDSHTNAGWDRERGMLVGRDIRGKGQPFRVSLDLARLRLSVLGAGGVEESGITLSGKTLADADAWVVENLRREGLAPDAFLQPLHFDMSGHGVARGEAFSGVDETFAELSRYYSNAAEVIGEIAAGDARASELRCWPHHFDLATLITVNGASEGAKTLGLGFSPGDGSYSQPYFYASPWPYPDAAALPEFPGPGRWHTKGWTGAVLTADELLGVSTGASQDSVARTFLKALHVKLSRADSPVIEQPGHTSG